MPLLCISTQHVGTSCTWQVYQVFRSRSSHRPTWPSPSQATNIRVRRSTYKASTGLRTFFLGSPNKSYQQYIDVTLIWTFLYSAKGYFKYYWYTCSWVLVPEWDLWGQSWVLATELSYPGLSWARLLPPGLPYTKYTSSNPAVNPAWPEALLWICRNCSLSVCNPTNYMYLLAYSLRLPFGILGNWWISLGNRTANRVLTMSDFPPIVSWDANYVMKIAWNMHHTAHACHSSFRAI